MMHLLPTGSTLPEPDWQRRHRIRIAVALAHAAGLAVGERFHERVRRVCADGTVVEVDLSFAAAADATGRIDSLTLIGRLID